LYLLFQDFEELRVWEAATGEAVGEELGARVDAEVGDPVGSEVGASDGAPLGSLDKVGITEGSTLTLGVQEGWVLVVGAFENVGALDGAKLMLSAAEIAGMDETVGKLDDEGVVGLAVLSPVNPIVP
jgi:hypothetical protein